MDAAARLEAATEGGASARIPALTKALINSNLAQRQVGFTAARAPSAVPGLMIGTGASLDVLGYPWERP